MRIDILLSPRPDPTRPDPGPSFLHIPPRLKVVAIASVSKCTVAVEVSFSAIARRHRMKNSKRVAIVTGSNTGIGR